MVQTKIEGIPVWMIPIRLNSEPMSFYELNVGRQIKYLGIGANQSNPSPICNVSRGDA